MIVILRHILMLAIFLMLWFLPHYKLKAVPTTYYASATGTGSVCTLATPCRVGSAWALLVAGDTLILNDGTYTGSTSMISTPNSYNAQTKTCPSFYGGTAGNLITVKAAHDGLAILDGQTTQVPGNIRCVNYMRFEGIRFQNSVDYTIRVIQSSHNEFIRLSGYNAFFHLQSDKDVCPSHPYDNYHVFAIENKSNYNLVEDPILSGSGRDLFNFFDSSNFNILRGAILIGGGYTQSLTISGGCSKADSSNHGEAMQMYSSSNNVAENVVAFGIGNWPGHQRPQQAGVNIWANTPASSRANSNSYYNTVVMNYQWIGVNVSSVCAGVESDQCLLDATLENVVSYQNGVNIWARNGRNVVFNHITSIRAGLGEGAGFTGTPAKSNLYLTGTQDADQTSSWTFSNMILANGGYGCKGEVTLKPTAAPFTNVLLYGNSIADYFSNCVSVPKTNVVQGVNPALTSLVYVAPTSPAYTMGTGGTPIGADLRCKYNSTFNGSGGIDTTHTNSSMWPLPDLINNRAKAETLQILGTSWDPNAVVLDALGPRNTSELPCPTATPPVTAPPDDSANYKTSQGTNATTHTHVIPVGYNGVFACVALWDSSNNVGSVTSVTSGGEALTLVAASTTSPAFRRVELWRRLSPTTGSRSIVVNTTGGAAVDGIITTSFAKQNVQQFNTVVTETALAQSFSVTAPTAADEEVVDCFATTKSFNIFVGADQRRQQSAESNDHSTQSLRLVTSNQFGLYGGAMQWALQDGSQSYSAHVAVSLSPQNPIPPPTFTRSVTEVQLEGLGPMDSTPIVNSSFITNTGSTRLRFEITGSGDPVPPTGYQLFCQTNGGGYVRVMDDFGSNKFRLTSNRFGAANVPTLTLTRPLLGSVATFISGAIVLNQNDSFTVATMPSGYTTEMMWMIDLNTSVGDVINCRPHINDGSPLDTPDGVVATINAIPSVAGFTK